MKQKSGQFHLAYFLQGLGMCVLGFAAFCGWIAVMGPGLVDERRGALESPVIDLDWSDYPRARLEKLLAEKGADLSVQKQPLRKIDPAGFLNTTPYGNIPKISADGTTPFDAFRRRDIPTPGEEEFAKIAIVMIDYCLSGQDSILALDKLSSNVALGINPYCADPKDAGENARELGHELWMLVPMEGKGYPLDDSGPLSLLVKASTETNIANASRIMAMATSYAGIITHHEPAFTASKEDFTPILDMLDQQGLALLETNLVPPKYIESYARAAKLPYNQAHVHIDDVLNKYEMELRFHELERTALDRGAAIGLIRPVPLSITMLLDWSKGLAEKKIRLVPLSAAMNNLPPKK